MPASAKEPAVPLKEMTLEELMDHAEKQLTKIQLVKLLVKR